MSRPCGATCLLVATFGFVLSSPASAWTPYGPGPYGPDNPGQYREGALPPSPAEPESDSSRAPPSDYDPGRGGSQGGSPYGGEAPRTRQGDVFPIPKPPQPDLPGYGSQPFPPWGYGYAPSREQVFGPPARFRISRQTSDDAYNLTIGLDGIAPDEVQVRAQGHWILISRQRSEQQIQKDSFDDGRGYRRSFSYSSGTTSRRLSVPPDGDLSAMSRDDGESSIRISIPRRGH
jgi:hypothetical protein